MRLLVCDFDGVISDSAREIFAVALATYARTRFAAAFAGSDRELLFQRFMALMPLGNRAEDFGVALEALATGIELPDQATYAAFYTRCDPLWLETFHSAFYVERERMAVEAPAAWYALMRPYAPFLEVLRRHVGEVALAIATSKDRRSVRRLLSRYGVDGLFPEERLLDKETGQSKCAHLSALQRCLGVVYAEMTFLDDKVTHLDAAAALGVRCALAAWGYNGPREHALARERGYLLCSLEDVDERLFRASCV